MFEDTDEESNDDNEADDPGESTDVSSEQGESISCVLGPKSYTIIASFARPLQSAPTLESLVHSAVLKLFSKNTGQTCGAPRCFDLFKDHR